MSKPALIRLSARIVNTPLMIDQAKLNAILLGIGPRLGLDLPAALDAGDWVSASDRRPDDTDAVLAVIPVYDSLVFQKNGIDAESGLTSYDDIRAEFRSALSNPRVKAIIFRMHSPGGEVHGVFDLADEIYNARGLKPIYAVLDETAYSAAYLIASAADKVFIPRTGGAGSIGVRALHVDQSGWDEKQGLKFTPIFAGARKNDFSPHEPPSLEAMAWLQAEINELYDLFVDTVARNRSMTAEAVRATEAGIYQGQHAVDIGLADQVLSWDAAIKQILTDTGGSYMDQNEFKTQLEGLLTSPELDAGVDTDAVLSELGYMPKTALPAVDVEALQAEARAAGAEEATSRMLAILDMCQLAQMPEMAAPLLKENCSVEDARKKVLDAKAAQSGKDEIISTVGATTTGEINPVMADAQKRAQRQKEA